MKLTPLTKSVSGPSAGGVTSVDRSAALRSTSSPSCSSEPLAAPVSGTFFISGVGA